MIRSKTCCFTGHRSIPTHQRPQIVKELRKQITRLIEEGVIYYGAGGALGFDTLAALTVLELREKHPQIKLILVLPCPEQSHRWQREDIEIYESIKRQSDKIVYTAAHYTPDCMHRRNRHLVDNSGVCVCYQTKPSGGTAYTVSYARQQGIRVINLAEGSQ